MRRFGFLALITTTILVTVARPLSASTDAPVFHLCKGFIESFKLGPAPNKTDQWLVYVKLTPAGTLALADLTRDHLGETAEVRLDSTLVVETQIQAIVDSGLIQSSPRPGASAKAFAALFASPPSEPCGVNEPPT